jgi:hypothetical protein
MRRESRARKWGLAAAIVRASLAPRPAAAAPAPPQITAPAEGASVSGTVSVAARAGPGVAGVQFLLDGAPLGARVNAPPFQISWNTEEAAGDTHVLSAAAWDAAGSSAVAPGRSVVVDNTPFSASEVTAASVAPGAATISWATNRPADSAVDYGPSVDYGSSTVLSPVHAVSLTGLAPGELHYRVRSKDAGGKTVVSADAVVAVAAPPKDAVPPAALIMNPAAGASVSSTVTVSVNATDNVGVVSVELLMDGTVLGAPATAAPYLFGWNTLLVGDGAHILGAIARDAAGNAATSPVVRVVVDNAPPVISGVNAAGVTPVRADVLWRTDKPADSAAEFGATPAYGNSTAVSATLAVGHGVSLTGLAPGTLYHYRVKSRGASGILAVSDDAVFTALEAKGAAPGGVAAAVPADADVTAKAPQKILTPATADGINDKAVFGPDAKEVSIFDLRGKQVFHESSSGPGVPVVWSARDASGRVLSSGVYLARIITRSSKQVMQSFSIVK